jgi:hypothetical protein
MPALGSTPWDAVKKGAPQTRALRGRYCGACGVAYTPSHKFVRSLVTSGREQPKRAARESNRAGLEVTSSKHDGVAPRKH